MSNSGDAPVGGDKASTLVDAFERSIRALIDISNAESSKALGRGPSPISLRVDIDGLGSVEACIGSRVLGANEAREVGWERLEPEAVFLPLDRADRVQKAKDLLSQGKVYQQGCSGFVCEVLGIPWESANSLMGADPAGVGNNNAYPGLQPGDIAGWKSDAGSGHVTVYVGEPGTKFIDVRSEGEKPRKIGNGYGNGRPLYKSSRF